MNSGGLSSRQRASQPLEKKKEGREKNTKKHGKSPPRRSGLSRAFNRKELFTSTKTIQEERKEKT